MAKDNNEQQREALEAQDQQGGEAQDSGAEEEVIFKLNPDSNLGGYAFGDGKSIVENQVYRATASEYDEYKKARTTKSDGSTVSVVKKA